MNITHIWSVNLTDKENDDALQKFHKYCERGGRIYKSIQYDGKESPITEISLIDTGADISILPEDFASKVNYIQTEENYTVLDVISRTTSNHKIVLVDIVFLDLDVPKTKFPFIIRKYEDDNNKPIIGMNILKLLDITINTGNHHLILNETLGRKYEEKFREDLVKTISPVIEEEIKYFQGEPFDGEMLVPQAITTVFSTEFLLYDEAIRCFFDGHLNASAALCRSTIDSTLYIASTRIPTNKTSYDYDVAHMLDSKGDIKDVNWGFIKSKCLEIGILAEKDLDVINRNIRERGNMTLHFIQIQDQLIAGSVIENTEYKEKLPSMRKMFEKGQDEIAREVLDETGKYLIKVLIGYFAKYSDKVATHR